MLEAFGERMAGPATMQGLIDDGRLGRTNHGKGCIRFGRLSSVDLDALRQAIRDSFDWAATQERRFGRNCAQPVDDG